MLFLKKNEAYLVSSPYLWLENLLPYNLDQLPAIGQKSGSETETTIKYREHSKIDVFPRKKLNLPSLEPLSKAQKPFVRHSGPTGQGSRKIARC